MIGPLRRAWPLWLLGAACAAYPYGPGTYHPLDCYPYNKMEGPRGDHDR